MRRVYPQAQAIWILHDEWLMKILQMDADPDVLSLAKQLRNHLESMQNNASQVSGIRDAITRAQSALSMLPLS